jgi:PAS domain S-box-containing protein
MASREVVDFEFPAPVVMEYRMVGRAYWRQALLDSAVVSLVVVAAALALDYVANLLVIGDASRFEPLVTGIIASAIALPISYLLTSQRRRLMALREELVRSLGDRDAAVAEADRRRTEAEEALVRFGESDRLYRLLAENLTDNVSYWSGGVRRYISPSVERQTGFTVEEFEALPLDAIMDPDAVTPLLSEIGRLRPGDPPLTREYTGRHKDGALIWYESTFSRVAGETDDLIIASRVITERKLLELELKDALKLAETSAAAKTDFLANMTHELRTPLTAIVGFAELLKGSAGLGDRERRHVARILDASDGLMSIIDDVLDFSRIEARGLVLDAGRLNAGTLVRSMIDLVQPQADWKTVTVQLQVSGETVDLVGDGPRLGQAVLNFLSNAVKFTPSGGSVQVRVEQDVVADGDRVRVSVADTGVGIEAEKLHTVFDRFAQADAAMSRRFGGAGLGLAICKRIVEAFGGRIGVRSEPGQGSEFWFEVTLPRAQGDAAATEPKVCRSPGAPLRLLLVEDNTVNRELVLAMLEPFDIVVDTAEDGAQGVEAAGRGDYDLILMDVQMPVMDGLTATRRIRDMTGSGGRTPIVALTANVLPEQVTVCLEAGMDAHLGKPIKAERLLETIANWTGPGAAAG